MDIHPLWRGGGSQVDSPPMKMRNDGTYLIQHIVQRGWQIWFLMKTVVDVFFPIQRYCENIVCMTKHNNFAMFEASGLDGTCENSISHLNIYFIWVLCLLCQLYFIEFQYIYIYPILYFHIIMWPIFLLGLFLLQFHSFRGGRKPACSSMKACWLWPRAITPVPGAGKPNQWLKSGKSLAFGRFDGLIITEYESFWTFRASNIFCLSSHLSTDLFRSCI